MAKSHWGRTQVTVILLLLLTLVAAEVVAENALLTKASDRVGIALDWAELQGVAGASRLTVPELSTALREEGARYLLIREDTLGRLVQTGHLQAMTGWQLLQAARLVKPANPVVQDILASAAFRGSNTYLLLGDGALYERLKSRLSLRYPAGVNTWAGAGAYVVGVSASWDELAKVGIGVDPRESEKVRELGYEPVLAWQDGSKTRGELELDFRSLDKIKPALVLTGPVPSGLRDYVGRQLAARGILQGVPEFTVPSGAGEVAAASGYAAVRVYERPVHTIYQEYLLAVRDRNVRLLIPHLLWRPVPEVTQARSWQAPNADAALANANVGHLRQVVAAVRASGLELGAPEPFRPHTVGRPVLALLLALLAALAVVASGRGGTLAAAAAFGPAFLALLLPDTALMMLRKGAALAVAGTAPAAAVVLSLSPPTDEAARASPLRAGVSALTRAGGITLVGALAVQALLGDTAFLLKLDAFAGIKLAYTITLTLVFLWAYRERLDAEGWWCRPLVTPVEIVALAGLGLLAWVLFNRSGNTSVIPISAWELKARSFLEAALFVRPRTKEFLLGHPALVLAAAGWGRERWWRPYLVTLAAVGTSSLLNTFVHLHTPFLISLARALLGLLLGGLLGSFLIAAGHLRVGGTKRHA